MILAVILLAVCQVLGFVGLSWFLRLYFDRKQAEIEARITATLKDWMEQPAPDQPSKFAQLVQMAGTVIGSAAAHSIMASLNASDSHAARAANSAADSLQAQTNPLLALLAGGKRGKGAAVLRLAEMLGPLLTGAGRSGDNGHATDVAERLKRQG